MKQQETQELDRIGQKFIDRIIARRVVKLRYKAKAKGLKFNITPEYLRGIYPVDNLCPALGTTFNYFGDYKTKPTIDRIIPEYGYIKGNVVWVSQQANLIMSCAHPEDVIRVGKYAEAIFKKRYPFNKK